MLHFFHDLITGGIQVDVSGSDVVYRLPARTLGRFRPFGFIPIVIGIVFFAIQTNFSGGAWRHVLQGHTEMMDWILMVFSLPFIAAALIPIAIGCFILAGRCRVEWRKGRLAVIDHAGPFRWKRRMPNSPVRQWIVSGGDTEPNRRPVGNERLISVGGLAVQFPEGEPRILVIGYPKETLQTLAKDLSTRTGGTVKVESKSSERPVMEPIPPDAVLIERMSPEELAAPPVLQPVAKPMKTDIRIEVQGDVKQIVLPPRGLWKGTSGFILFPIVWCSIISIVTLSAAAGKMSGEAADNAVVWLMLIPFWVIGIGTFVFCIHVGIKKTLILVQSNELQVAQKGLFKPKQWQWQRQDISQIIVGDSGTEVNHRQLKDLQIHTNRGTEKGFFTGRDEKELEWLAQELRQSLKMPPPPKRPEYEYREA